MKRCIRVSDDRIEADGALFKKLCVVVGVAPTKSDIFELMKTLKEGAAEEQEDPEPPPVTAEAGPKCSVYCLELEGGKFYVGRSGDYMMAQRRIQQHKKGGASEWTNAHPYLRVVFIKTHVSLYHEDLETLKLIAEKGVENVRGGSFCQLNLPDYQRRAITDMLRNAQDLCFSCGQAGHFVVDCPGSGPGSISKFFKPVEPK